MVTAISLVNIHHLNVVKIIFFLMTRSLNVSSSNIFFHPHGDLACAELCCSRHGLYLFSSEVTWISLAPRGRRFSLLVGSFFPNEVHNLTRNDHSSFHLPTVAFLSVQWFSSIEGLMPPSSRNWQPWLWVCHSPVISSVTWPDTWPLLSLCQGQSLASLLENS